MTTWYDQINRIQLDVTSYCNAKCLSCLRNVNGTVNIEGLKLDHIDVELIRTMFNVDLKDKYIENVTFNGVYGDACMHPDLLEIVDIIYTSHSEASIAINTNGSLRSIEWWKELANSLSKFRKSIVLFAIDGLEDTHHIYRRNTDFNKILENIRAFNSCGGIARVVTTIFDHNKHQLDDIQKLAEELGCHSFNMRRSHTLSIDALDENGEFIPNTEPITAPDLGNSFNKTIVFPENEKRIIDYLTNVGGFSRDVKTTKVNHEYINQPVYNKCIWHKQERMVQIDPWGYVWPCCWIGRNGHDFVPHLRKYRHKWKDTSLIETNIEFRKNRGYDYEFHNLKNNSIIDILQGEWFNKTLPDSFTTNPMSYCTEKCGIKK